jgi:Fur family transcriptional regulator, ferric uptake regulator
MTMDSSNNRSILSGKGCKNTKSRAAVVEVLEKMEMPVSAEDIYLQVKERGFSTNLSTVYRTLELLESKGLLEKSVMSDSRARFQLVCNGHKHHVVCTGCHKMIPIDSCPLEIIEKNIGESTKFDITGHKLELYGLCPQCKKT